MMVAWQRASKRLSPIHPQPVSQASMSRIESSPLSTGRVGSIISVDDFEERFDAVGCAL